MEGTLEPCHLHLVSSTSLIALAWVAVNITKQKTILLDLLITLGEGDKALKCLPYYGTNQNKVPVFIELW